MNYIFEIKKDGDWRLDKVNNNMMFYICGFKFAMKYALLLTNSGYQVKAYSSKTGKLVYQSAEIK